MKIMKDDEYAGGGLEDDVQDGTQNIYGKVVKFFAISIITVICFFGTTFSLLAAVMIINQDLDKDLMVRGTAAEK